VSLLFGRYDGAALGHFLEEAGVLESLRAKGFRDFTVAVEDGRQGLSHIAVRAHKGGGRHLLLDACLRRVAVSPDAVRRAGLALDGPFDLLLVYWVRAEDPTADFAPARPRLPLQNHPGLGVLRRAFRVAVRIGTELGVDGVASQPKFFHDAVIFHRSRLFLFLDGGEQGRFEALERDLDDLPLRDASMAVAGWCVRDADGRVVHWQPGYQVFPVSTRLTAHFHAPAYAGAVAAARAAHCFRVDAAALAAVRAQLFDPAPSEAIASSG
jgi:hypothetical protein